MKPLNFCRDIVSSLKRGGKFNVSGEDLAVFIGMAMKAEKFCLPVGGRLIDDPELRALDCDDVLSLPFPLIALEVPFEDHLIPKAVTFAWERGDGLIGFVSAMFNSKENMWVIERSWEFPKKGFLGSETWKGRRALNAIVNFDANGDPGFRGKVTRLHNRSAVWVR